MSDPGSHERLSPASDLPSENAVDGAPEDCDSLAWEAIRDWAFFADARITHEELDYALLSRFFLWDKVGRAVRSQLAPERFAFEAQQSWEDCRPNVPARTFEFYQGAHVTRTRTRPLLLSPWPTPHLAAATEGIIGAGVADVAVLGRTKGVPGYEGCEEVRALRVPAQPDPDHSARLHESILKGLDFVGLELLPADVERLRQQLRDQAGHIRFVEAVFAECRPDALLLHVDNHAPYQDYVMVARREGIPTVMLQHGLDCERYYLEDAFAGVIATWGEARASRYRRLSERQPDRIEVTGHPAYDRLQLPDRIADRGDTWLWTTRPHVSNKCFAPSRWPEEGLQIFEALVRCMDAVPSARLVIKPHPSDYTELYRERIAGCGVADRIEVSLSSVDDLIADAAVVISEDTTAGMDAMFQGKPLCHVHFAASAPVTPFVDYGAALSAFSGDELLQSLQRAAALSSAEKRTLLEGQRSFLKDHAGECDGRARDRVVSLVADVLNGGAA